MPIFDATNLTTPICEADTCKWITYTSLAVCTSSADVTRHLSVSYDESANIQIYSLPGGYSLRTSSPDSYAMNVTASGNFSDAMLDKPPHPTNPDSLAFPDRSFALANFFIIYKNQKLASKAREGSFDEKVIKSHKYSAIESIFEWCVQKYHTNVSQGVAHTTIDQEQFSDFSWDDGLASSPEDGFSRDFYIPTKSHKALRSFLSRLFEGLVYVVGGENPIWFPTSEATQAIFDVLNPLPLQDYSKAKGHIISDLEGLAMLLDNVAKSLTHRYVT